jgi:hypothetical protein
MNLLTYQKVYVKDAIIDRIWVVESKIKDIETSSENLSNPLKFHLQELHNELISLAQIKRQLEQKIYDSSHSI